MVTVTEDAPEQAQLFEPVRKQRAFEMVLAQLESRIMDGSLGPGDRLPNERALSAALDVSRPSLREALRILEAMDVISVHTGIGAAGGSVINDAPGTMVSRLLRLYLALGHFTTADVVSAREALEGWTVRSAALNRTADQLASLRTLAKQMDNASLKPARYFELDSKLHVTIAQAAGNPLVTHLMTVLRDAFAHQMLVENSGNLDWAATIVRSANGHRLILDAIDDRDPDAAAFAIADHLANYSRNTL